MEVGKSCKEEEDDTPLQVVKDASGLLIKAMENNKYEIMNSILHMEDFKELI